MSANDNSDDLALIKGIGPVRRQWLRKSLKVRTVGELAALSAGRIEARLKADGQNVSHSEIERWLAQAHKIVATTAPSSQKRKVAAKANTGARRAFRAEEIEWKPFASFVVEFQARTAEGGREDVRTSAHHMEADQGETWSGIESEGPCKWMLQQLGARAAQKTAEAPPIDAAGATRPTSGTTPAAGTPVTVEVIRLEALQPPQADSPNGGAKTGGPVNVVWGGKFFALAAAFRIVGPAAPDITEPQPACLVKFYARDLSTGVRTHLGDAEPERSAGEIATYVAKLPGVILKSGIYGLTVTATARVAPDATSATMGIRAMPMLQVV
jgi:hypothetical protein